MIEERTPEGGYQYEALRDALLAIAPRGRLDAATLGYWLRRHKGKAVAGKRFANSPLGNSSEWWIEEL
jgi:hypothetical protein